MSLRSPALRSIVSPRLPQLFEAKFSLITRRACHERILGTLVLQPVLGFNGHGDSQSGQGRRFPDVLDLDDAVPVGGYQDHSHRNFHLSYVLC